MKVYDPDQVLFLFATVPIADGTFINIEAQERFVTKVGADGVVDVSLTDRANRKLPDIAFTAELAGAIHRLVRGKVTV
jgi:hypothetical protein